MSVVRSLGWCFTINNWTPEDEECLALLTGHKYIVFGRETGEDGTPHLQGFVQFKSQRTLSSMSKALPRAHLEVTKGRPDQAAEYCKKDGDFYEEGEVPLAPNKGEKERESGRK